LQAREYSLEIEYYPTSQAALKYMQISGLNIGLFDNIVLKLKDSSAWLRL